MRTLGLSLLLIAACGSSRERPPDGGDATVGLDGSAADASPDTPVDVAFDVGTSRCTGLTEPECAATAGCVPMYDDRCCPVCDPGPCADCVEVRFHSCVADAACESDICGRLSSAWCAGVSPVCPDRFEGLLECLRTPGCVVATDPSCAPDCDPVCTPVLPEICDPPACDVEPPVCPEGERPAVRGDCYLGLCIPDDVCVAG